MPIPETFEINDNSLGKNKGEVVMFEVSIFFDDK